MTMFTVFVIGAPGSGKGTLCKKAADLHSDFGHVSLGDKLRRLPDRESTKEMIRAVKDGELVPMEKLAPFLRILVKFERDQKRKLFFLDGFPRSLRQAIENENDVKPDLVLLFDCDGDEAKTRFTTRQIPGREGDDSTVFDRRYAEYCRNNPEIVEHYRSKGILVEVDTSKETHVSFGNLLDALTDRIKMGHDEMKMLVEIVAAKEELEQAGRKMEALKMMVEEFTKKVDEQLVQHRELEEKLERQEKELELMKTLEELLKRFGEGLEREFREGLA
ncbi:P-loop containing nucleoside triphosphate hydrolase protein [Pyrenochaeta sp. DS3sAY3a]|nr:P-loop containing nucleoside triphosphate hydrolase protein [Pyrenochaeta sp. DS3sAY3a]